MRFSLIVTLLIGFTSTLFGQKILIDKVVAKVGGETILLSDIESQFAYVQEQGQEVDKCQIMQMLIGQKLIVNQARLDSIEVADSEIEAQLDFRIQQVLRQMNGDEEFFEEYYGMTVKEMRSNLRNDLEDQLLGDRMRQSLLNEVNITPKEVVEFYEGIPTDSIPFLSAEVELSEIVVSPEVNEVERISALEKAMRIQRSIVEDGEDFAEMALKNSDDPGSAQRGGDLGFASRGSFVNEFEAAAFNLDKDEVSIPVETEFGFHIIQLLERRGNKLHLRHILIRPDITLKDHDKSKELLDSIRTMVLDSTISYEKAVKKYSSNKVSSYHNNGRLTNPINGKTIFETSDLPSEIYFATEEMNVGGLSEILEFPLPTGETQYKIIRLESKSRPHKANLEEDYSKIKEMAKASKKNIYFENWVNDRIKSIFIEIDSDYIECPSINEMIN